MLWLLQCQQLCGGWQRTCSAGTHAAWKRMSVFWLGRQCLRQVQLVNRGVGCWVGSSREVRG